MEPTLLNCMIAEQVTHESVKLLIKEQLETARLISNVDNEILKSTGLSIGQIARIRCAVEHCKERLKLASRTNCPESEHESTLPDDETQSTSSSSTSLSQLKVPPPSTPSSVLSSSPSELSTTSTPSGSSTPKSCRPAFSHRAEQKVDKNWLLSFKLPERFSSGLSNALSDKRALSNSQRNELTRDICSSIQLHTLKPSDDERKDVSRMLVRKYPFLGDTLGASNIDSWKNAINNRFKTVRRTKPAEKRPAVKRPIIEEKLKKRRSTETVPEVDGETQETCKEHVSKMKHEMTKPSNKNFSMIKQLMEATYNNRRSSILTAGPSPVAELITKYPALQLVSEMKAEIARILDRKGAVKEMTDALKEKVPSICKLGVTKGLLPELEEALEDNQEKKCEIEGAAAVSILPALLKQGTKQCEVIKLCSESESIDDEIAGTIFPRLVASGTLEDITPLYIVAEGKVVAKLSSTSVGLPMALVLLMGCYYIFNIEYPLKAKNVYLFLEATLLNNTREAKNRVVVQKFLKELEQAA